MIAAARPCELQHSKGRPSVQRWLLQPVKPPTQCTITIAPAPWYSKSKKGVSKLERTGALHCSKNKLKALLEETTRNKPFSPWNVQESSFCSVRKGCPIGNMSTVKGGNEHQPPDQATHRSATKLGIHLIASRGLCPSPIIVSLF